MSIETVTRRQIALHYSADSWDLYDGDRRDDAAMQINGAIAAAYNDGGDARAVRRAADAAMRQWVDLGACDSEGLGKLDRIIEALFPPDGR